MSTTADQPVRWDNAHRHFLKHLAIMPGWHKAVILLAGALALLGTAGQITARFNKQPAAAAPPDLRQAQHFAPDSPPAAAPSSATRTDDGGLLVRLSPHAVKIG